MSTTRAVHAVCTLAPNSTKLARFWTDLATSVRVLPAADDGGSTRRDETHIVARHMAKQEDFLCASDATMLTINDVEHSGVEDGWTDQSQKDEAAGGRMDEVPYDRLNHNRHTLNKSGYCPDLC